MLLVDGVRPIDAVCTVDTLMVAYPEPLSVTGEVGDMLGDHVIQLGLACPVAVDVTMGLAVGCTDPEPLGLPLGVSELRPLEGVGERVPHQDGDTLTVEL